MVWARLEPVINKPNNVAKQAEATVLSLLTMKEKIFKAGKKLLILHHQIDEGGIHPCNRFATGCFTVN